MRGVLLLFLVVASALHCANGHIDFVANLTSPGGQVEGSAVFDSFIHDVDWDWTVDIAGIEGVTGVYIVDGNPTRRNEVAVVLSDGPPSSNRLSGEFIDADINPMIAANMKELAGHVCMGHIFAMVNTTTGPVYGVVSYVPETDSNATCEEAVESQFQGQAADAPYPGTVPTTSSTSTGSSLVMQVWSIVVVAVLAVVLL